jgi:hypothetical protein
VATLILPVAGVKNVKQKTRGESRDQEEQRGRLVWKVIRKRRGRGGCQGPTRTQQGVDPTTCNSVQYIKYTGALPCQSGCTHQEFSIPAGVLKVAKALRNT